MGMVCKESQVFRSKKERKPKLGLSCTGSSGFKRNFKSKMRVEKPGEDREESNQGQALEVKKKASKRLDLERRARRVQV